MPVLRISGNYVEIARLLKIAVPIDQVQSPGTYVYEVKKDIHRTCYLSGGKTVEQMQRAVVDTTQLRGKPHSYTQGNLAASVFDLYLQDLKSEMFQLAEAEGTIGNNYGAISTAYESKRKNFGISIAYVRKDPKPEEVFIPVENRQRPFILTVIENTVNEPKNRIVTCLLHMDLATPELLAHGTIVEDAQISEQITAMVKQRGVSDLFSNLLAANGSIEVDQFNALKARLQADKNIDDRDLKRNQIDELTGFVQQFLSEDGLICTYLSELQDKFSKDLDLAKDANYAELLNQINTQILAAIDRQVVGEVLRDRYAYELKLTQLAIGLELEASKPNAGNVEYLLLQAAFLRSKRNDKNSEIITRDTTLEDLVQSAPITFNLVPELNQAIQSLEDNLRELNAAVNTTEEAQRILQKTKLVYEIAKHTATNFLKLDNELKSAFIAVLKFHTTVLANPRTYAKKENVERVIQAISKLDNQDLSKMGENLTEFADSALQVAYTGLVENLETQLATDEERSPNETALYRQIDGLLGQLTPLEIEDKFKVVDVCSVVMNWKNDNYSNSVHTNFTEIKNEPALRDLLPGLIAVENLALDVEYEKQLSRLQQKVTFPVDVLLKDVIQKIQSIHGNEQNGPDIRIKINNFLRACGDFLATQDNDRALNRHITLLQGVVKLENIDVFKQVVDFGKNWDAFNEKLTKLNDPLVSEKKKALYQQGLQLKQDVKAAVGSDFTKLDNATQSRLTNMLKYAADYENKASIRELAKLTKEVSGHESPLLRKLGTGFLVFAGLALVALGVLAAIPTGGASLLATILAVVGVKTGLTVYGITVSVAALSGFGFFSASQATGVASSLSTYNDVANAVADEAIDVQGAPDAALPRQDSVDSGDSDAGYAGSQHSDSFSDQDSPVSTSMSMGSSLS